MTTLVENQKLAVKPPRTRTKNSDWTGGLIAFVPVMLVEDQLNFLAYANNGNLYGGVITNDGYRVEPQVVTPPNLNQLLPGDFHRASTTLLTMRQPYYLAYDSSLAAGANVAAGSISLADPQTIQLVPLSPIATVLAGGVPFVVESDSASYFLLYQGDTVTAWQITVIPGGLTLEPLAEPLTIGTGWDSFISLSGLPYFMAYRKSDGFVAAGRINETSLESVEVRAPTPNSSDPVTLDSGLTSFATYWVADDSIYNGSWFMGYNGNFHLTAGLCVPDDSASALTVGVWQVDDLTSKLTFLMSSGAAKQDYFLAYNPYNLDDANTSEAQDGVLYIDAGPRPGIGTEAPTGPIVDRPATDKSIRR
jgi:hypothetical protein